MTQRKRSVMLAAIVAVVSVLVLQVIYAACLIYVRANTNLDAIRTNITQAFADGVLDNEGQPRRLIHRYGHQFTECTALHLSIDDEPDSLRAALLPQLYSKYVGPCAELERSAAGIDTGDRTDYARYWHGYRLYIWPLLETFSLPTVRLINATLLFGAVLFFFTSLRRIIGSTEAVLFMVVLMSLTDIWRMWNITPHALSTVIILVGVGLFAQRYQKMHSLMNAIVLAAVLGSVFNFYDFLINPPMMPMLLAFIVIAVDITNLPQLTKHVTLSALTTAGLTALSWFGGYALTWASKWALAAYLSTHSNEFWAAVVKQIALRLYGVEADSVVPIYPLVPTLTMIVQSFISAGSLLVAILAAALFIHARGHWVTFDGRRFLLLGSPTMIATLWFELLSNHTQTHSHFTYRSESAAIAIALTAFFMATKTPATIRSLLGNLWLSVHFR